MEYALFGRAASPSPELVIAAPGEPDASLNEYLDALRTRFSLPIQYIRIDETVTVCPL